MRTTTYPTYKESFCSSEKSKKIIRDHSLIKREDSRLADYVSMFTDPSFKGRKSKSKKLSKF